MGLKRLGMESRGLLGEEEGASTDQEEVGLTGKERRRRKREKALGGGKKGDGIRALGREELLKMEEEIGWDRENIVVRKVSRRSRRSELER